MSSGERGFSYREKPKVSSPDPNGTMPSMLVTLDRAGRIVIPKDIRDRLSLSAEAEFEIAAEGDEIRLTPVRIRSRQIVEIDGWPVIAAADGLTITDHDVQRWRDADQR